VICLACDRSLELDFRTQTVEGAMDKGGRQLFAAAAIGDRTVS